MPELPEVETVRRAVWPLLIGHRIGEARVWGRRVLRRGEGDARAFRRFLRGGTALSLARRGKFLWARFRGRGELLVVHLGMSGSVHALRAPAGRLAPRLAHEQARLVFEDGAGLAFVDPRTFGHMEIARPLPTADGLPGGAGSRAAIVPASLAHIARDPLDPAFDAARVAAAVRASRRAVKTQLLDQTLLSGVGNIYADEMLFRAGIGGWRLGSGLSRVEAHRLIAAAAPVLEQALQAGGTSFDAAYVRPDGTPGGFAAHLQVYGRAGGDCTRCGSRIRRTVVGGRSHYYCPSCQVRHARVGTAAREV